jgi:nucleotide-binding universal stress UspA family protein
MFLPRKRVVVPFDFSEVSLGALPVARELVADPSALHVIHVLSPIQPMEPGVVWKTVDDASRVAHATKALREVLPDDLKEVEITVLVGSPAREIVARARALGAELIVLPSHGRSGAERVLMGSVSEQVVRHAHCPVLVLRS